MKFKISIITVCYNSIATIEDTIRSVIDQSYKNIEYIIIDGGSTDGTLDVINRYDSHVDKCISESDKGIFDAMNKGVEMATGDVVGLINSDDIFNSNQSLEKVMKIFNSSPELDSLYADLYYVSQKNINNIVRYWVTGKQKPFIRGWHPAHPAFYVKKDIYNKRGLYNVDLSLAADFEIMLRFIEKFQISTYYLEEPLVKMRLGGASNNSLRGFIKQNIQCIKAFKLNNLPVNTFMYPFNRLVPKLFQFTGEKKHTL